MGVVDGRAKPPALAEIGFGCFVPDLTRLSNPPCGEAHPIPF